MHAATGRAVWDIELRPIRVFLREHSRYPQVRLRYSAELGAPQLAHLSMHGSAVSLGCVCRQHSWKDLREYSVSEVLSVIRALSKPVFHLMEIFCDFLLGMEAWPWQGDCVPAESILSWI